MPVPPLPDPQATPDPARPDPARPDPARRTAFGEAAVVDLLAPVEVRIAATVAVGDGNLDAAAVATIAGVDPGEVDAHLVMLTAIGVLRRTPDGRLLAAHALVRDALLAALDDADRRALREQVAATLWRTTPG